MTTKAQEKTRPQQQRAAPQTEDLHAAYLCHTLAQILHGHIAARFPQEASTPYGVVPPMTGVPAPPWTPAGPDVDAFRTAYPHG